MVFDPTDFSPLQRAAFARDLAWILRNIDPVSRVRGREYAEEGRVVDLKAHERGASAVVIGSEPYNVELRRAGGCVSTSCGCPVALRGAMCKHVAALACVLGGQGKTGTAAAIAAAAAPAPPAVPRLVRELPDVPARPLAEKLALYMGRTVPPPLESWRRLREWWRLSPTKDTSVFRHAIEACEADVFSAIDELRKFRPPPSPSPGTAYGALYDRLARRAVELTRLGTTNETVPPPLDGRHPGFDITYTSSTRRLAIRERRTDLLQNPMGIELTIPLEDMAGLAYGMPMAYGGGGGGSLAELFILRGLLLAMIEGTAPALRLLSTELSRAPWERLLDHLVPAAPAASTVEDAVHFSAVPIHGSTFQVRAHLHGTTKTGKARWKRLPLEALARGVPRAPESARRVARLLLAGSTFDGKRGYVDAASPLGHEVLLALRAHGTVFGVEPERDLDLRASTSAIVVGDLSMSLDPAEDGMVRPHFWVGESELPSGTTFARPGAYHGAHAGSVHDAVIYSFLVPPSIERWLDAWLDEPSGLTFPPDALEKVATKVAPLVASGAVRLPKATLGAELALELEAALRVEWRPDGTAVLELLASVHPSAPLVAAGSGPELFTFRHEGARVFVERDKSRELAVLSAAGDILAPYVQWEGATGSTEDVAHTLALVEFLKSGASVARVETKIGKQPHELEWGQMESSLTISREGAWFAVRGDIRLGDTSITLGEVLDAARLARKYVPAGDGAFVVIPEEVQARLLALATAAELAKTDPSGAAKIHDAFAEALAEAEKMFTRSEGVDVVGYAKALAAARTKKVTAVIEHGDLREYQTEGASWMLRLAAWAPGCILADDMGLGKTVQTASVLLARQEIGPALVVAPASVSSNWKAELARFVPSLRVQWLNENRTIDKDKLGAGDVVIVSYGLLPRLGEALGEIEFATLVLDEAQFLKNAVAQRSSVVRAIKRRFTIALTGTPLENHLGDLWSLFDQVFPGLLGREADFRERFRKAIETGEGSRKLESLSHLVVPFLLRRTRKDVLRELPARDELTQLIDLSVDEAKRYAALRRACEMEFAKEKRTDTPAQTKIALLAALTRLRQLACDVSLVDDKWTAPSSKLVRLTELATTLAAEKNRVLVFSQFRQLCIRAKAYLERAGLRVAFLAGDTPTTKRKEIIDAFQRGEFDAFCISLMAGGTGLNLTHANYVIHLDPWWNPAVEEQATSRAHRMGQTESVTVVRLVSRGTIEEGILELHAKKRDLATAVLEGKSTAKVLTADDLLALVRFGDGGQA
ncbi:hypothetical protein BH09MYX1_BH09MYX1_21400 [soil metagenome]